MSFGTQHALVAEMADLMNEKFNEKRRKDISNDEWWNRFIRGEESVEWLLMRLQEELGEFIKWYRQGDWHEARRECGDVSNFSALIAWMMADREAKARRFVEETVKQSP